MAVPAALVRDDRDSLVIRPPASSTPRWPRHRRLPRRGRRHGRDARRQAVEAQPDTVRARRLACPSRSPPWARATPSPASSPPPGRAGSWGRLGRGRATAQEGHHSRCAASGWTRSTASSAARRQGPPTAWAAGQRRLPALPRPHPGLRSIPAARDLLRPDHAAPGHPAAQGPPGLAARAASMRAGDRGSGRSTGATAAALRASTARPRPGTAAHAPSGGGWPTCRLRLPSPPPSISARWCSQR